MPPFAVDFTDLQPPSIEGGFVVRRGKYFELGEYPDKQFSLAEAEADAAVQGFTPGPLNIEHMPTIFDGKLGTIRNIWRTGKDIFAEYAIPAWLHEVTKGEPIKVSSEWNRQSKMAVGGALVLNPRVTDAAMMAAFSQVEGTADAVAAFASKANADQMQRIHDQTTSMGAECGGKSYMSTNVAEFLSPDELKTVQKLHDLTATFDDCCNRYQTKQGLYGAYYSENRAAGSPKAELPLDASEQAGKGKKPMFEGIKKLFTRAGVPQAEVDAAFAADAAATAAGTTAAAVTTETATVGMSATDQARFTALETEAANLRAEMSAQGAAATFAEHSAQINTLERVFKLSPAEGDKWREVAEKTPAAFAAALPALAAREPLPQIRGKGNTVRASQSADTDRLQTLTTARMKDHSEDYVTAFKAVCTENPDLALSVRMSAQEGN